MLTTAVYHRHVLARLVDKTVDRLGAGTEEEKNEWHTSIIDLHGKYCRLTNEALST